VDWMPLIENRTPWWTLINTVINLRIIQKARNFLTSCVTISFSRKTLLHVLHYLVSSCNLPVLDESSLQFYWKLVELAWEDAKFSCQVK